MGGLVGRMDHRGVVRPDGTPAGWSFGRTRQNLSKSNPTLRISRRQGRWPKRGRTEECESVETVVNRTTMPRNTARPTPAPKLPRRLSHAEDFLGDVGRD